SQALRKSEAPSAAAVMIGCNVASSSLKVNLLRAFHISHKRYAIVIVAYLLFLAFFVFSMSSNYLAKNSNLIVVQEFQYKFSHIIYDFSHRTKQWLTDSFFSSQRRQV
ncbi:hypothetical protein S245_023629, partial [Arachis hypogaea]